MLFTLCRYAQSYAFISVIELPRIPAYFPKIDKRLIAVNFAARRPHETKELPDEILPRIHPLDPGRFHILFFTKLCSCFCHHATQCQQGDEVRDDHQAIEEVGKVPYQVHLQERSQENKDYHNQ